MREGGNFLKRNNGGLRSGCEFFFFFKWPLPEGRLNSGRLQGEGENCSGGIKGVERMKDGGIGGSQEEKEEEEKKM